MEKRLRRFAEAGVTDLNARIVALGEGREEIKASAERTPRVPRCRGPGHSGRLNLGAVTRDSVPCSVDLREVV